MRDQGPGAVGPYDGQVPTPLGQVAASKRCGTDNRLSTSTMARRKHDPYDVYTTFYRSGGGAIQLRYGRHNPATNSGFGWRHIRIKHGWSPAISWCIARTYNEGNCEYEKNSVTRVRCRKVYRQDDIGYRHCPFRLVYELNPARRGPSGPLGIVTAFFEGCWTV